MQLKHLKLMRFFRLINKKKYNFLREIELVKSSSLWDEDWYLSNYSDLTKWKHKAARHYVKYGWKEGRNPGPQFNTNEYLSRFPELRNLGMCPLVHYEGGCKADKLKDTMRFPDSAKSYTYSSDKCVQRLHKRLAIFASFSSDGLIPDYVVYYLKELKKVCDEIVLVADNPIIPSEVDKIKDIVSYAKFSRHCEYDFGSYKRAFEYAAKKRLFDGCDELIFCNDSCYGPVYPFCEMFNEMGKRNCDFWGVSKNIDIQEHLQSFFLVFKKNVFSSEDFKKFIESVERQPTVKDVILKYEVQLTKFLSDAGFKYESFIEYPSNNMYYPTRFYENLTSFPVWMMQQRSPLIKVKNFSTQPSTNFDGISETLLCLSEINKELQHLVLVDCKNRQFDKGVDIIKDSPLFDADFYEKEYNIENYQALHYYYYIGWMLGYNPSPQFCTTKYLDFYEDVKKAKMNPLLHYEKYGRNKRYLICADYKETDILLLTSTRKQDGVFIWRVEFLKELFEYNGYRVEVESVLEPSEDIINKLYNAKTIIFNRPSAMGKSAQIIKVLLKLKKKLIIDIDDLIINDFVTYSGRYRSGGISYDDSFNLITNQSLSFWYADLVITSTPYIAREIQKKFKKETLVLPNVISDSLISKHRKEVGETFKVLYVSGSKTHDFDVSTIYLDLLNIMEKHQDIELSVMGQSGLPSFLTKYDKRVKLVPYYNFSKMIEQYAEYDLLLVPLEDNPFNNAKSNIKYIEAGAVGTPVLATDVAEFKSVIKDGVNGFLYHDNFYDKFEYIYQKRHMLPRIGKAAYNDVKKNHSTAIKLNGKVKEVLC